MLDMLVVQWNKNDQTNLWIGNSLAILKWSLIFPTENVNIEAFFVASTFNFKIAYFASRRLTICLSQSLPGPTVQLFAWHRNVPRDCHSAVTSKRFHGYLPDHGGAHGGSGTIQMKRICIGEFASDCIAAHSTFISLTSSLGLSVCQFFFHLNGFM